MCGIVGFYSKKYFSPLKESLPEAVRSLTHRGPDDTGLFWDEEAGVGLGHRRLSILDLSESGRQPMVMDDGRIHIVYNGEIYNFRELRSDLEKKGHRFSTNTDTEVILKAYSQWGIECLPRMVGMFALCIWDQGKQRFLLARDRLGIKPLYYYFGEKGFLFGSELKGLMALEGFPRDVDMESIPLFLHYQYIPAPRTIFKHTFKLLPGYYALLENNRLTLRPYWELPAAAEASGEGDRDEETCLEQLDHILTQAVSDHLVSDVPLGALLSGGIDSSLVVALMQKVSPNPVRTFSIGFREQKYNEAPWAARIAESLGTQHTEFYVTPREALEVIPKLPTLYDEPFADSSAVPTYLVSRLARSQVTVALTGDGGDEQFAGYVRYWTTTAMVDGLHRISRFLGKRPARLLSRIPAALVEKLYGPFRMLFPQRFRVTNVADKWHKFCLSLGEADIQELYRMTVCLWTSEGTRKLSGLGIPESLYEETFQETEGWPLLSRLMRVDQKTYLPDAMLTKVDRASMAVGLEVRVPLLDHRAVEFASGLPLELKYRNGKGKYILRRLLARYVPEALFERPKMGFGIPLDQWLRTGLSPLLSDYLSPGRLKREGLFDPSLVGQVVEEHLSGRLNHQYRLWPLLIWEMWREKWLH